MPILRQVKTDFFKTWNPEMAYILGFFAADGSMVKNNRGACFIEFNITDLDLLEKIRKTLGSNHKISHRPKRNKKWKDQYRLQIGSKEMFADLGNFGFTQAKSKKMRLPDIPIRFLRDFVRGYFDGDGNVHLKQYYAKDRGKMRWVFSACFTSGSKFFLEDLHTVLSGIIKGGFIQVKRKPDRTISGYSLVFSHRDGLALFRFMYNNSSRGLLLKRKHQIFKQAARTLHTQT